ncbi:MAG: DUF2334 domain-containing protein [FCB group bacterium]
MYRKLLLIALLIIIPGFIAHSADYPNKKILILAEGDYSLKNFAVADGRQLANLLGHFNTTIEIEGINKYKTGEIEKYDYTFYIGFHRNNKVPDVFVNDIVKSEKPVVWLNTGIIDASQNPNFSSKFGFNVNILDSVSIYDIVKSNGRIFTKGEENCFVVNISNKNIVQVLATAYSTKKKKEIPYIVKCKNLIFIGDSPFAYADENDRYLLFADMLHDIMNEPHEESHSAIVRIEDVTPMHDPGKLRDIADLLSARGIPFLVGVVPIYVDPGEGLRVTLSEKPEIVDALKYMVKNGGTIVMHGVTHQYHGVSTNDFEFWDRQTNQPIKGENEADDAKKIELGIQEFMKNGLYPVLWETPHYTASSMFYNTITKYFSTAIEQRLAIENFDYSQYFPYIINKDIYGQRIFPENLGFVPYDPEDKSISEDAVKDILKGAKTNLYVRDGFAAFFFHPFLDLDLLKDLVEGIQKLGYTFIDVKDYNNIVKTRDKVILTGTQDYTIQLDDQYLQESYFNHEGDLKVKVISPNRVLGEAKRHVELAPGETYSAHPTEYREREIGFFEKTFSSIKRFYNKLISSKEKWQIPRTAIIWNYYARGSFYNDQASFVGVFHSVNINVDTIFIGQKLDLARYNLLIVPIAAIDSLRQSDYDAIVKFVQTGGCLITDNKNYLADEFGFKFSTKNLNLSIIRDMYFPDEKINWKYSKNTEKLIINSDDEVFAQDAITDAPVVIGRKFTKGKIIFFSTLFDPYSQLGYSRFPYLLEYVKKYFNFKPIVKRDNLEVYFDPGFRSTYSVENLIKLWTQEGIRIIHVAGWHQYPTWTYNYKKLVDLAHANGILVYAWIEPPQVNKKFWDTHPEWREKNYKGQDVNSSDELRASWRFPVAMTDINCLEAMKNEYLKFLQDYDWDGVNLAELYFEAGKGFNDPLTFTPMHKSAQKEFKAQYGIDITNLFNPTSGNYWKNSPRTKNLFINYRINKLNEIYELLLGEFAKIASKKTGFQTIVTAMDSYGTPELKENLGVDMENIIQLSKKYKFSLNVEDPLDLWSTDPTRYEDIGHEYDSLLGGNANLLLDLNILSFRKNEDLTPFPTLIQTGTESFLLVNSASSVTPRVVIYSESSINPQDLFFMPYALTSDVKYSTMGKGYEFDSPYSFYLDLPEDIKAISLNGRVISPSIKNSFLIPAGKNYVQVSSQTGGVFSTSQIEPKIISITGNLLSVRYDFRNINFAYSSATRTLLAINREPILINVDGKTYPFTVMKGNDCYSVFLPTGNHTVDMVLGDAFSYGINLTSLWSSTGIALFGILAVALLFVMYVSIKIINKRTSKISLNESK